jgi:hypothetical protein
LSPRGVPVACPRAEDDDTAADRVPVTESVVVVVVGGGRWSRGSGRRCGIGVVSARRGLDIVQGEMHHCSMVYCSSRSRPGPLEGSRQSSRRRCDMTAVELRNSPDWIPSRLRSGHGLAVSLVWEHT